jgi:hypothetical protein
MTFVYPLLLGGLALAGIPVLIHLIMQQKPKRLPFPAFRFLLQKHRTNQRRLRLRHLLLLLLRLAVIAALCLALARPKLSGGGVLPAFPDDRPVRAVFLIDTSPSMEYTVAGKSWLDEARRRALELFDELPEGSRVAVLDSAELGGEWGPSPSLARERLAALQVRFANAPLTRQIDQAYRLFAELDREQDNPAEAPPKVLYVFSDRTRGCWDGDAAKGLQQPADVSAVFVDVGQDAAADLAITEVRPERTTVRPGETVRINVTVQATGADYHTSAVCRIDDEKQGERRGVEVKAGQSVVIPFERKVAAGGLHQAEVRLDNNDALPFDNAGFTTFRVLEDRGVLVLTDNKDDAEEWRGDLALTFHPDVLTPAELGTNDDLSKYAVVCLVNVARPGPELWERLDRFVRRGGGLAVVPGGEGWQPDLAEGYGSPAAREVLPGQLLRPRTAPSGANCFWTELEAGARALSRHPFLAPFRRWKESDNVPVDFLVDEGLKPRVRKYWQVKPADGADVVVHYTDPDGSPALLERRLGPGRLLLLSTAFDRKAYRDGNDRKEWNNYYELTSSFGFVLVNLVAGYLAGDAEEAGYSYTTGQAVPVPLPARPFFPRYTLVGPGVVGADTTRRGCRTRRSCASCRRWCPATSPSTTPATPAGRRGGWPRSA